MRVFHTEDRFLILASRAFDGGALPEGERGRQPHLRWNVAGKCERPVYREISTSRPTEAKGYALRGYDTVRERTFRQDIELEVPCRQCPPCLKARAFRWAIRAREEIAAASRTWFGTLTLRPEEHFRVTAQACVHAAANGVDFETLSEGEQFALRHNAIGEELKRYLKRVRKQSQAPLRFMMVAEAHKSGLPHYHCLLHEADGARPVRHACLQGQWKMGFSNWKLADSESAFYVAKYLAKSSLARVRASRGYGPTRLLKII